MTLSVIIVSYNVKYFLEQCLYAVRSAGAGIEMETIVIDNNSSDQTVPYLAVKFPEVRFVANNYNAGFAKACNEGAAQAKGDFILFLNPDTLVAEDSFTTCLRFFASHADCGMVGVQMIDGSGRFLKESKRSFPDPVTASFKLFGLSRLFPGSPLLSRYHLGHLDRHQNHEVDVLAGAYMMLPRQVLDKVGHFDETFFMYGEDIDLSYRVQRAGYKNYYLSETTIIHFKGESTRMGSLNYVRLFYRAMGQFVKKHYGGTKASVFRFFIQSAISIRAILAAFATFLKTIGLPVLDAVLIWLCFWLAKSMWANWVRPDVVYHSQLLRIVLPVFTIVYLITAYYAGLYDKYYRRASLLRSTITATLVLLAIYALLPEDLRFSRGIVLCGAFLAFVLIALERMLLLKGGFIQHPREKIADAHILIAGSTEEYDEIIQLLATNGLADKVLGRVALPGQPMEDAIASMDSINTSLERLDAQELIFCARTLSYQQIIELVKRVPGPKLRFHAYGSTSLVGSDEATGAGEVLTQEKAFGLSIAANQRVKRLIDTTCSLAFLLTFPIHLFAVKRPLRFLLNCLYVLIAKKTWVGYYYNIPKLPNLRAGVTGAGGVAGVMEPPLLAQQLQRIDYLYARDYKPVRDLRIILRNYKQLGS